MYIHIQTWNVYGLVNFLIAYIQIVRFLLLIYDIIDRAVYSNNFLFKATMFDKIGQKIKYMSVLHTHTYSYIHI